MLYSTPQISENIPFWFLSVSLITVLQQCLAEEGSASTTCTQDKWFSYCEIGFHAGCFR